MDTLPLASSSSTMLPTPPRAAHNKENECPSSDPFTPRKSRIAFADHKEIFTFSPALASRFSNLPSSPRLPNKSILRPSRPLAPFAPAKTRDITPFPDTPLDNSHYLAYPIGTLVDESSTLRELTEAYSILAARIRQSVPPDFFDDPTHDTRYKLFQPVCKNSEALTKAIERDLGRVFTDPFDLPGSPGPSEPSTRASTSLPTPQQTPSPKKGGMNEEQVVFARDLQTTASAAVKLLTLVLQSPAIFESFKKHQLKRMLTSALAIPLAETLRSPCARKVCGFAITLLQSQRLPDDILETSADRIAFALKRALVGELGREGKKGATAEALRAIHDLCLYKPGIFVPALAIYLTAVLELLMSASCVLRVLAAHALGGYTRAITMQEFDFTELLNNLSPVVQNTLLDRAPAEKSGTTLLRTLRTAIQSPLSSHPGQSPFWSISVIASIIILAGPALLKDSAFVILLKKVIQSGMQTGKKVVRAVTHGLLGPLLWSWRKWRHSVHLHEGEDAQDAEEQEEVKASFQKLLQLMTKSELGSLFVGALLGPSQDTCQQQDLLHAIYHIGEMANAGGHATEQALRILERLVNAKEEDSFYKSWESKFTGQLTPPVLYSVAPGLLTLEVGTQITNSIASSLPKVDDIRPLSQEERQMKVVWLRVRDTWLASLHQLSLPLDDPVPPSDVIDIWTGLVKMVFTNDSVEGPSMQARSELCGRILASILLDPTLDLRDDSEDDTPGSILNQHLKLVLVAQLWSAATEILPAKYSSLAAKILVRCLVKKYVELVDSGDEHEDAMDLAISEWAALAASVDSFGTGEITLKHWNRWDLDERSRARIWRAYARAWSENKNGSWKLASVLLGLPFSESNPWDMSDADLSVWNTLLTSAIEAAGRCDVSGPKAIDQIVQCINHRYLSELDSTLRMTDHLVTAFDNYAEECTTLPEHLPMLLKTVLESSYPPKTSNKIVGMWLLRSIQSVLGKFSSTLAVDFLESIQGGLSAWFSDDIGAFTDADFSNEIVPLFQTTLVQLEALPPVSSTIFTLSPLIESAVRMKGGDISEERKEALLAFEEFWNNNCVLLKAPRTGWPEGLSCILRYLAKFSGKIDARLVEPAIHSRMTSLNADSDDDELDVLPRTITPRRRPANTVPLPPSPAWIHHDMVFNVPTTPEKPVKSSTKAPRLPALFAALTSPSQHKSKHRRTSNQRTHRRGGSSSKNHLEADKENAPPAPNLSSDDVVLHSKRALLDVDSTPVRATKKQRTESNETANSDDSVSDENAVEQMLSSPGRKSRSNSEASLSTPSKRALVAPELSFIRSQTRTPFTSPTKRRKTQPLSSSNKQGACVDDDKYLPPSSDSESDEEDDTSSSPIGPFTPVQKRKADAIRSKNPDSDDSITLNSSPTRCIKRAGCLSARPLAPLPLSPVF